jgi:choice-of-anchor C domain-containing protein
MAITRSRRWLAATVFVAAALVGATAAAAIVGQRTAEVPDTGQPVGPVTATQDTPTPVVEEPVLSADGHDLAFVSVLDDIVPGDENHAQDVFVQDRISGALERVSVSTSGAEADGDSAMPSISADGRYVVFESTADDLIDGTTIAAPQIYRHDRQTGTTILVSKNSSGNPLASRFGARAGGSQQDVSDDGRYVAYESADPDVMAGAGGGDRVDVYVRDLQNNTSTRVSNPGSPTTTGSGTAPNASSATPALSADGQKVAFESQASNLVSGDTNGFADVFVADLVAGTVVRASVTDAEAQAVAGASTHPSISADGSRVVFGTYATNFAPDSNFTQDIVVRDLTAGSTWLLSNTTGSNGTATGRSEQAHISRDGDTVVFASAATNLVSGDTNHLSDIFTRAADASTPTAQLSVGSGGTQANGDSGAPVVDGDGGLVAFVSGATNLTSDDADGVADLFTTTGTGGAIAPAGPPADRPGANLVKDPSFEPPDLPTESSFESFGLPDTTHLGAWMIDSGGIDVIGPNSLAAVDGSQTVDMNGNGFGKGSISQTIAVQANHTYTVSFDLSSNTNGPPAIKTIDVSFGATTKSFSADNTGHTTQSPGWVRETFAVSVCVDGPATLRFTSTTESAEDRGPDLDAIKVADTTGSGSTDGCSTAPTPTERYVTAAYHDLLGRAPDASGLAYWAGRLDGHRVSRTAFVRGLANSNEGVRLVVAGIYLEALHRAPDARGLAHWVAQIRDHHRSVAHVVATLFASHEAFVGPGGGTNDGWITFLYQTMLQRDPDPGGLAHWSAQATHGRTAVAYAMFQSSESRRIRVTALYEKLLQRAPDAAGRAFWANRILTDGDIALAADLAASDEYFTNAQQRTFG